jgi:hypothetical protein
VRVTSRGSARLVAFRAQKKPLPLFNEREEKAERQVRLPIPFSIVDSNSIDDSSTNFCKKRTAQRIDPLQKKSHS